MITGTLKLRGNAMYVYIEDAVLHEFRTEDREFAKSLDHRCLTRANKAEKRMQELAFMAMRSAAKHMKELEAHE